MARVILCLVCVGPLVDPARAVIVGVAGGTKAPPAMLGPYEMTPFAPDPRPTYVWVSSVPSPLGGDLAFSSAQLHLRVGEGWAIWGHGYTGDVYSDYAQTALTLELPPATRAFYFYASADPFSDITVTADGEVSLTQWVYWGDGAAYFGFYVDDAPGTTLKSLAVSASAVLAVGEFGIAIPEPGALTLLAAGGLLVLAQWVRRG